MKKIILTFSTTLFLMFFATSMFSQSESEKWHSLIGRAKAAASVCIADYRAKGLDIKPVVETNGICIVLGELQKVSFYAVERCQSVPCPRPLPKLVASVYFDCDVNIISVECAK